LSREGAVAAHHGGDAGGGDGNGFADRQAARIFPGIEDRQRAAGDRRIVAALQVAAGGGAGARVGVVAAGGDEGLRLGWRSVDGEGEHCPQADRE
jgi:hypothetical protein